MVAAREASTYANNAYQFANDCVDRASRTIRAAQQSLDANGLAATIAKDASHDAKIALGKIVRYHFSKPFTQTSSLEYYYMNITVHPFSEIVGLSCQGTCNECIENRIDSSS